MVMLKTATNNSPRTDEQYVGGDDLEPDHNDNMPAMSEILIKYFDQEPVPESNLSTSTKTPPTPATSGGGVKSVTDEALELHRCGFSRWGNERAYDVKRSSHSCSWAQHFTKSCSTCLKIKSNSVILAPFILSYDNQWQTTNVLLGSSLGR